jgi:tetratricopeptide (TPR) repeat protein
MGLLDWLFGHKRQRDEPATSSARGTPGGSRRAKAAQSEGDEVLGFDAPLFMAGRATGHPPEDVKELGDGSPLVFFQQGNMTMIMDRDAFDYVYGDAKGPDPAQHDLDDLLPRVTRVCVLEGAMFRGRPMGGRVLLDTREAGTIKDLASCLRIIEDPATFDHCQCLGGPTMELYAGLEHVATIGVQHGHAIRWERWHHDAQLQDGGGLTRWLRDQGVDPGELEVIYQRGNNFLVGGGSSLAPRKERSRELLSQADQQAQEGRLVEALALCTQALELDPSAAEAYATRGQVHFHAGRLAEALIDCSAAIERGLRHPQIYFIRAVALDYAGRLPEALADCSMALHLDPESSAAYNSRGLVRSRLGQIEEALADFTEAIRLEPDWFRPHMQRAYLYHGLGRLDRAVKDYDRAIELMEDALGRGTVPGGDPTPAVLYCRRGDARHDLFREEEAEADFDAARRHHPAVSAHYLGDMWRRRGRYDKALEAFAELVRLDPDDPDGYLGRGSVQEALGDLEPAADDYSAVVRLQHDGGPGYALRARVRHRQGRPDEALADLSEHLRLHPDDPPVYVFRSALHKERKAWAPAIEDLNSAHRLAPDDAQTCNNLAWMLATCPEAELRDGPRAVELARRACQATKWENPFCLGTLAAALAETGAFDKAAHWQAEALALYPAEARPAAQSRLAMYRAGQPYRE